MSAATPVTAAAPAAAVAAPRRFYELDSLRGLAAATVVLHHFNYLLPQRWHDWFAHGPLRIFVSGHQAVMLFFVLSGFVLTLPYLRRTGLDYRPFLIKRLCRIYLPYLAALVLALLADRLAPPLTHALSLMPKTNTWIAQTWSQPIAWKPVLAHVLFIGVYDNAQYNTAFWSLVYEMRISLVFPFIAWAVLRRSARASLIAALALWVLSIAFNKLVPHLLHASPAASADLGDTIFYAAMFILGAVLAKYLHTADRWYARLRPWQVPLLALASLFLYAYAAPNRVIHHIPPGAFDVLSALGTLGMILLAINCGPIQRALTSRAIHHLGKVSYSLYLIHGTVLFSLIHTLLNRVPATPLPIVFFIYLAATAVLTELFHRLIESPTMHLGRRLTTKPSIHDAGPTARHMTA